MVPDKNDQPTMTDSEKRAWVIEFRILSTDPAIERRPRITVADFIHARDVLHLTPAQAVASLYQPRKLKKERKPC